MESPVLATPMSPARRWTAHIIGALVVLFLVFDGATKVIMLPQVMKASVPSGLSPSAIQGIGAMLLVLLAIYLIPATSILGAVLLTGYLGGATAINLRAGDPPFGLVFPAIFGILMWLPVYLRNDRLRALMPVRRPDRK